MEVNGRQLRLRPSSSRLQELLLQKSTSSAPKSSTSSSNENKCLICQNKDERSIYRPSGISQRVFNSCSKYLHTAITQDSFKGLNVKEKQLPLCHSCFESALELNQLSEQLEKFQHDINNVILTFSLKILHRRSQVSNSNPGSKSQSGKQTQNVNVDISVLSLDSTQLAQFEEQHSEANDTSEFYVSPEVIDVDEHVDEDPVGEPKNESFVEEHSEENWNESGNLFDGGYLHNSEEVEVNEEELGAPITTFSSYYDTNMHLEPNRLYSVDGSSQLMMPPEGNEEYHQDEIDMGEYGVSVDVVENMEEPKPVSLPPMPMLMKSELPSRSIIVRHKNYCRKCGKICSTSYNLLLHEKACDGQTRYVACHICGNTFSKRSALNRHIKAIHHIDQESLPVVTAVRSIIKMEPIVRPQFKMEPIVRPQFKIKAPVPVRRVVSSKSHCKKCGKVCSTEYNLTLHERACTGKRTIIPCKLCGKTFNMHSALLRHSRTVHSQERPFKCSACPKRFNRREFLRNHFNRTHAVSDPIFQQPAQ